MATIRQQLRLLDLEGEKEVLVPIDYIVGLLNELDKQSANIDRLLGNTANLQAEYDDLLSRALRPVKCKHKHLDVRG